jgi:uncharacterized protein YdhG (YjbR/CyaY superfamily)
MQRGDAVQAYIDAQPIPAQPRLRELRAIVRAAVPEAEEVIRYGMPTYRLQGRSVHFGAAARHCALYGGAMAGCADQLVGYKTSRGTVQFPLDRPIPEALVTCLVVGKLRAQPLTGA